MSDKKLPNYYSPRISSELPDCSSPLTFDTYSRCSMRCRYCVPKGSGITMADGTIKKVQNVKIGDVLLGYNEDTKMPEATTVLKTMNRGADKYATFKTDSSSYFSVTLEHPIFTKEKGWIEAGALKKGVHVLQHNKFISKIYGSRYIELIFHKKIPNGAYSANRNLYSIWNQMVQRCHNPNAHNFKYYGLRGIQVCKKWRYDPRQFYKWAEKHGYKNGLEIDRIDNNGDYKPNNCRFVTHKTNSKKRGKRSDNNSGYIGVSIYKTKKGKIRYRSNKVYDTPEQAAIIRDRNVTASEFVLNFPRIPYANFKWVEITYIRTHYKDTQVYNFECWPNNNYCVQAKQNTRKFELNHGVVVHNCFSHSQKDINPGTKNAPLQAVNPEKLLQAIDGKSTKTEEVLFYKYFYSKRFLFHWGGLADSFCHYERKYGNSYPILKGLLERKYPLMFSSKGPAITDDKYVALFEKYKKQNTVVFQFSIVTADDKLAKQVEPGVPSPTQRFEYMKTLSSMGYDCILRLRPFIIGVTDETLPELLEKAYSAGAVAVSTEFYAMDHRCVGSMKEATIKMGKLMGIDDIFKYFSDLSPKARGGYCRLNRMVKEPYVRYIYTFCKTHNMLFTCSDPDFKELSGSGNCCGVREDHPTLGIGNWSRHQLTWWIKEARRYYHATGGLMELHFDSVYSPTDWIFDDIKLSHQDIGCTKFPYAMRKQLTLRHLLQEKWNNLKAYSNPRNYFDGKLLPIGVDDNDNYVYRYNPSFYEKKWTDDGIDLT